MRNRATVFAAAIALAAGPTALRAETPAVDAAAVRIDYGWGEGNRLEAESFELPVEFATALGRIGPEGRLLALGFPLAPGERGDVEFERFDVHAPGAKVVVVEAGGTYEIPGSPRVQLLGTAVANTAIRIGISVNPDGSGLSGLVSHPAGVFEIATLSESGTSDARRSYEIALDGAKRLGVETRTSCETPDHPEPFDVGALAASASLPSGGPAAMTATHSAVVAFDTDAEFVADYPSPTVAEDAIADFVTAVNVIYERDLNLRILKGTTVLRTDAGSDPYVSSSTGAQLDELGNWWEANQSGVTRVFAALLSGKGFSSGFSCSGAGIAWVDIYCDPVVSGGPFDGGSYSATQVLRCVPLNGPSNVNLIGHEIGHNAGSGHTHCYSPPVDNCYKAQSGCYAGAVSCPDFTSIIPGIAAGKGTVMSYCHFSAPAGAACGQTQPFFHPTVITRIQLSIAANSPACVMPLASCSAGDDTRTVDNTTDNTVAAYAACTSITFGPSYTVGAGGDVSATSPLIVLANGTTIGGLFSADTSVP